MSYNGPLTIVPVRDTEAGCYFCVAYRRDGVAFYIGPNRETEDDAIRACRMALQSSPYDIPSYNLESDLWRNRSSKTQAGPCQPRPLEPPLRPPTLSPAILNLVR